MSIRRRLMIGIILIVWVAPLFAAVPEGLWIHYSAGLRGAVDPCGCRIPAGGIARRMGEVKNMRTVASSDAHLLVDAGEWRDLSDPLDGNARSALLLESLKRGPLVAVNVSLRDLMGGRALLDSLEKFDSIPFVSANLRLNASNEPLFPAYKIVHTTARGKPLTVAFIGATDPNYLRASHKKDDIIALQWTLTLKDAIDAAKAENASAIVLLTDAEPKRLDSLMVGVQGIQLILTSSMLWGNGKVNRYHDFYVANSVIQGKNWEAIKFEPHGDLPWFFSSRELVPGVQEDSSIVKLVADRKSKFLRKPTVPGTLPVPPAHGSVSGH